MTSRGPEDVLSSGGPDERGTYRVKDFTRVTELDVPLEDAELETAKHRQDLWADHMRRADGTVIEDPSPPPKAAGQAMVPDPDPEHVPVSHRRESWWRRTDWGAIAIRVPALAAVGMSGWLYWGAYRQERDYDAALAEARAQILVPYITPDLVPQPPSPLLWTVSTAMVFALGGLALLFLSRHVGRR